MHPLLAASLVNSFSNERVARAKSRAQRQGRQGRGPGVEASPARSSSDAPVPTDAPALVRLGRARQRPARRRLLAEAADEGVVIVAEVDGELQAARVVDDGVSVANPFRPSAPQRQLLALRASQLGGAAPQRSRRARLRVLRPHTS